MINKREIFEKFSQELKKIKSNFNISNHKIRTETLFVVFRQIAEKGVSFKSNYANSEKDLFESKLNNLIVDFEKKNNCDITYNTITYQSPKKITVIYYFYAEYKSFARNKFRINVFLELRLEEITKDYITNIYINNKKFTLCKYLLMNIPAESVKDYDEINSIDEAMKLYNQIENEHRKQEIEPEAEFWGHCSNLQSWYENNYDTRLLDSRLSFPLLSELARVGDPIAKKVLKDEIAKRLEANYLPTIEYLLIEHYLDAFGSEELEVIFEKISQRNIYEKLSVSALLRLIEKGDLRTKSYIKENPFMLLGDIHIFCEFINYLGWGGRPSAYTHMARMGITEDLKTRLNKPANKDLKDMINLVREKQKYFNVDRLEWDNKRKCLQNRSHTKLICRYDRKPLRDYNYREYKLKDRPKFKKIKYNLINFKKIKYNLRTFYDFGLSIQNGKDEYHYYFPFKDLTTAIHILDYNGDIKIVVPDGDFAIIPPVKIYSIKKGFAIYTTLSEIKISH